MTHSLPTRRSSDLDVGDAQAFDALLAAAGYLDQGEFAGDMRPLYGQVVHIVHRHQAAELSLDMLDHGGRARGDTGDARQMGGVSHLGDVQVLDIVPTAGKQADYAGEDDRPVV